MSRAHLFHGNTRAALNQTACFCLFLSVLHGVCTQQDGPQNTYRNVFLFPHSRKESPILIHVVVDVFFLTQKYVSRDNQETIQDEIP